MKYLSIIAFSILAFSARVSAQTHLFATSWEVNFPGNDQYVDKTSYSGIKFEYRYVIKKQYSVGFALGWSTYDQYFPRQTFVKPDGNSAITTDYIAQIYQVPIAATFHYYLKPGKIVHPYAGIALGAQYLQQSLYYNVYVSDDNNWGFLVRPELGVILKTQEQAGWGILVSAGYSYSTNQTELLDNNSFKNVSLNLGIVFGH